MACGCICVPCGSYGDAARHGQYMVSSDDLMELTPPSDMHRNGLSCMFTVSQQVFAAGTREGGVRSPGDGTGRRAANNFCVLSMVPSERGYGAG